MIHDGKAVMSCNSSVPSSLSFPSEPLASPEAWGFIVRETNLYLKFFPYKMSVNPLQLCGHFPCAMISTFVVLASLACASLAAPATSSADAPLCDVSSAVIELGSSTLPTPKFTPTFVGLGVGTQNYTCASSGTYTWVMKMWIVFLLLISQTYSNVGALAELFDISCLYGQPGFDDITSVVSLFWNAAPPAVTPSEIIAFGEEYDLSFVLGEHYFVVNPVTGSGLNPKWDFTSHAFAGNPNAYVVGSKVDDVPAPTGSSDIDWLYLTNLTGSLANEIYRIETKGGQPPASVCVLSCLTIPL